MAMVRSYFALSIRPWLLYVYAVAGVSGLLVPRSLLWLRRWARLRWDLRVPHARVLAATSTSA